MAEDRSVSSARVALVTGASQGIGYALAVRLAREGFDVAVTSSRDLDQVTTAIQSEGRRSLAIRADFTEAASAARAVAHTAESWGRIDGLVNNAGATLSRPIEETTEEEFDRHVAINLKAAWLAIRAAAPPMRAQGGGSVVNI